jgi:hypothetical protein
MSFAMEMRLPNGQHRAVKRLLVCFVLLAATSCSVNAKVRGDVNTGAGADVSTKENPPEPPAEPPPASPQPAQTAAPAPTQAAPVASACPLTCYVAAGASRLAVTDQELEGLKGALGPMLGTMRGCVSPEAWRRRGSPVLNIRVAPDGKIAEVGVDPHHDHDGDGCFANAAQSTPNASFPGRTTIRCAERCDSPATTTSRPRAKRR